MEQDTPPRSSARPHAVAGSTDPVRGAGARHRRPCLRRHPEHGAPSPATSYRPRPPRAAVAAVPQLGSRPARPRLCLHSLPMAVAARPRSQRCHRVCRRRHVTRAADGPSLPARGDTAVPPSRSAPHALPQARGAGWAVIGGERWPPRRDQAEGGQPPRRRTALPECSARREGRARPRTATPQPGPSAGTSPPLTRSRCGGFDVAVMLVALQYQVKSTD